MLSSGSTSLGGKACAAVPVTYSRSGHAVAATLRQDSLMATSLWVGKSGLVELVRRFVMNERAIVAHYSHGQLEREILNALATLGADLEHLDPD
jgi:hypothetical protein